MAEKNFNNVRIVNKHDTEANWLKATGFTPKQGELIVYDIDSTHSYERIKIGDGQKNVNALPFVDDALRTDLLAQIGTVDNKVDAVSSLVGDTGVAEQISDAVKNKADVIHTHNWCDIGEEPTGGDTLYWDGNTDGLEYVMYNGEPVVFKISDAVQTRDDWVNGCECEFDDGSVGTLKGNHALPGFDQYGYMMVDGTLFIPSDNFDVAGLIIPTAGVWAIVPTTEDDRSIRRVTIPGYTGFPLVKKIDKKYLPKFAEPSKRTTVTLSSSAWTGSSNPWKQVITMNGVTANSKIDLQPTATQIVELQNADIMLMIENNNGVTTAYAIGGKPTKNYTMQALITEVIPV